MIMIITVWYEFIYLADWVWMMVVIMIQVANRSRLGQNFLGKTSEHTFPKTWLWVLSWHRPTERRSRGNSRRLSCVACHQRSGQQETSDQRHTCNWGVTLHDINKWMVTARHSEGSVANIDFSKFADRLETGPLRGAPVLAAEATAVPTCNHLLQV